MKNKIIVWFRRDLRLQDNAALRNAITDADQVIPLYIWSPEEESPWKAGGASKWWLHHSLVQFASNLEQKASYLIIRSGESIEVLRSVIKETKASGIYWNRLYEPNIVKRDSAIKASLKSDGLEVKTFPGALLCEPWEVPNSSKKPFQVFTPFWRKLKTVYQHEKPLSAPKTISSPAHLAKSLDLPSLGLLPEIDWDKEFYNIWTPGEKGAKQVLNSFTSKLISDYKEARDRPALEGTSNLAAHLHFGEITPKQVWQQVISKSEKGDFTSAQAEPFLRQIAWREFSHQLLFNFPESDRKPLRAEFKNFPWRKNKRTLALWQRGNTGYPLVDAGMRQLWQSGTMHNRVRMIVASFLVKHLLIPWQDGAKWFWDTLVDADLANNTMGWQWTAGCGADAAPYFRVFNPIIQGEKFNPEGDYVRRWIPELARLPKKWIHKPWEAPEHVLSGAALRLGRDYPRPIIEHREGRERALEAYEDFKEQAK